MLTCVYILFTLIEDKGHDGFLFLFFPLAVNLQKVVGHIEVVKPVSGQVLGLVSIGPK